MGKKCISFCSNFRLFTPALQSCNRSANIWNTLWKYNSALPNFDIHINCFLLREIHFHFYLCQLLFSLTVSDINVNANTFQISPQYLGKFWEEWKLFQFYPRDLFWSTKYYFGQKHKYIWINTNTLNVKYKNISVLSMSPIFVTPPFSPWRPGDAFSQEKEVVCLVFICRGVICWEF